MSALIDKYRGAYRQAKYLEADDTKSQEGIVGLFIQTVMYFNHYFIKAISIVTVIILSVSTLVTESCLGLYELQELSPEYNTTLQICSIDAHERTWFLRRIRDKMCKDVQMSPTSVYEIPAPFKKDCFTDLEMTTAVLTIVAYTLAMLIAIGFCAGFNSKNCLSDILALRTMAKDTSDNFPVENAETSSLLSSGQADTKSALSGDEQDKEIIPMDRSKIDDVSQESTTSEVAEQGGKEQKAEKSMKDYFTTVKSSSEKFVEKHFNFKKSESEETKTPDKPDESTTDISPEKPARNLPVAPDK